MKDGTFEQLRQFAERHMAAGRGPVAVIVDADLTSGAVRMSSSQQPFVSMARDAFDGWLERLDPRDLHDLFDL